MAKLMGYQGLLYYGTKGSTAATQITNKVDATYGITPEIGSTTASGDGSTVPINTGEATALGVTMTFNMIVEGNDNAIVDLVAASSTGNPIALRFIQTSGKLGLDADCVISVSKGAPLKGEQTIDISVESLSASLRTPVLNS